MSGVLDERSIVRRLQPREADGMRTDPAEAILEVYRMKEQGHHFKAIVA